MIHRLALYIEDFVERHLVVDCEYNRHLENQERGRLFDDEGRIGRTGEVTVMPDIILHRRNTDESNLIALEVKKPGMDNEHDFSELRAFRDQLAYRHVAHLVLGLGKDDEVENELDWLDD